ncbi:hypothetical protein HK100_001794 [Physocladia obscura]|uniref:SWIM-type domain-containing protein n=1 Tax=Physocladia obscura TaxID=109957 RepID=A0AAD5XLD2_9FUNG|nr:hypothetical protein HK100_001794 [Physocladia obscura]
MAPPTRACKYGLDCIRNNPAHFAKFTHPAKLVATRAAASSLSTSKKLKNQKPILTSTPNTDAPPSLSASDDNRDFDAEVVAATHPTTASIVALVSTAVAPDVLANISGVTPIRVLADGDKIAISSYTIKRTHDHYYCTCPAWSINNRPVDARTCKHLKLVFGDAYEAARLLWKDPFGNAPPAPAIANKPKRKKQEDKASEDEDEENDANTKKASSTKAKKSKKNSDSSSSASSSEDDDEGTAATKYSAKNRAKREETKLKMPALLLAQKFEPTKTDPTGWWISEKLDGVRAFWDHERQEFVSRLGNLFTAPDWFKEAMPKNISLDGELFGGRGKFSETVSVVKTNNSPHWRKIEYQIFDSPSMASQPFEDRIAKLNALYPSKAASFLSSQSSLPSSSSSTATKNSHIKIVVHEKCKNLQHVLALLKTVESKGGEGLMLREPQSHYIGKRSNTLLKVKSFYDAEAIVIGHEKGKGKNSTVTGSLKCQMASGKEFKIGTGLSDALRIKPPKIGAIVTYRFQELTNDGVPRFPSFVCERIDANKPSDAVVCILKKD